MAQEKNYGGNKGGRGGRQIKGDETREQMYLKISGPEKWARFWGVP